MRKASLISYMFLTLFLGGIVLVSSCSAQHKHAKKSCGTKQQKKKKHKSMKRGTSPGGGMLN